MIIEDIENIDSLVNEGGVDKKSILPYRFSFTYDEMFKAYNDCIINKKNTSNAISFSIDKNEKLITLCDEVNTYIYEIGKSIAFVVKIPVLREVFAADFRDRIIHHLVMNELMPYLEREFIPESFSCRDNKGVLYGVNTMFEKIRQCTENYTKDAYVLKMDARAFFMSINKLRLAQMIDDFIVTKYPDNRKKECLRWLCNKIIMHHPEENCERHGDLTLWDKLPPDKSLFEVGAVRGLPIGNLTSQIFANYYMNPLDHYIKEELGFEYYGRYVDDFMIISQDKQKLMDAIPLIEKFAEEKLKITIHRDKRYLQHYTKGVRFIGCVMKSERKYILNRTKGNLYYKLRNKFKHYNKDKALEFMMCVNSYLGFLGQYKTYNIRKKILTDKELLKEWWDHIIISKDYRKITLKDNPDKLKIKSILRDVA